MPPETHAETAKKQLRDNQGRFIKKGATPIPPLSPLPLISQLPPKSSVPELMSVRIINPFVYPIQFLKSLLKKQGVDFHLKIPPITAVFIAFALFAGGAGIWWFGKTAQASLSKVPVVNTFIPPIIISPTPDPYRDTAYTGILRKTAEGKFYLQTGDGQAVTLSTPTNISLEKYIGKKIFASGTFNKLTEILIVTDSANIELLIQSEPIPTSSPTPTVTHTPTPTFIPSSTVSPLPSSTPTVTI